MLIAKLKSEMELDSFFQNNDSNVIEEDVRHSSVWYWKLICIKDLMCTLCK